jgi:hypothetical protein
MKSEHVTARHHGFGCAHSKRADFCQRLAIDGEESTILMLQLFPRVFSDFNFL